MKKLYVTRVWVDNDHLYAMTDNGSTATYDLKKFRGLRMPHHSNFNILLLKR